MSVQQSQEHDEIRLVHTYDTAPWRCTFGPEPVSAPKETYPILVGVDGRVQGTLRRYFGNQVLWDLKYFNQTPEHLQSLWDSLLKDGKSPLIEAVPFHILTGDGPDYIDGYVVRHRPFPIKTSWYHQEWYVEDAAAWNDPNHEEPIYLSIVHRRPPGWEFPDTWVWISVREGYSRWHFNVAEGNKPQSIGGPASNYVYAYYPLAVTCADRYIYVHSPCSLGSQYQKLVIWLGETTPSMACFENGPELQQGWLGWKFEHLGPRWGDDVLPKFDLTGGAGSGGIGRLGSAYITYRLHDPHRNTYTGLANKYTMFTNVSTWRQLTAGAGTDRHRVLFPYIDLYRNLCSGVDPAVPPLIIGGTLYWEDRLKARTAISGWDMANDVAVIDEQKDAPRADHATLTDEAVTCVMDEDLAISTPYDFAQDQVLSDDNVDFEDVQPTRSAVIAFGCTFTLESVGPTVNGAGSTEHLTTSSQYAMLRWSCTNKYAPENFPAANTYQTHLDVDRPMSLVVVGSYIFAVGSGPIIRVDRLNGFVNVVELPSYVSLLSAKAVCEVRGQLLVVATDGVFLVEPTTGSLQAIEAVDRLMRDYWRPGHEISVGLDARLGALFIQNRQTKQAVVLWLGTEQATLMEDMNFAGVTSFPVDGVRRAVFITETLRFVVPRLYAEETHTLSWTGAGSDPAREVQNTLWGLYPGGPETLITDRAVTSFKIMNVVRREDDPLYGCTVLRLDLDIYGYNAGLEWREILREGVWEPTDVDFYWFGMNLRFLTGSHAATSSNLLAIERVTSPVRMSLIIRETYTGEQEDISSGDWLSVNPVPFVVVGSQLQGEAEIEKKHVLWGLPLLTKVSWNPESHLANQDRESPPIGTLGVLDTYSLSPSVNAAGTGLLDPPVPWIHRKRHAGESAWTPLAYDPDEPSAMITYLGATGHILFPYFASDTSSLNLNLWRMKFATADTTSYTTKDPEGG